MNLSRAYKFRDTLQLFSPKLGKVTTNRHFKRKSDHQRTLHPPWRHIKNPHRRKIWQQHFLLPPQTSTEHHTSVNSFESFTISFNARKPIRQSCRTSAFSSSASHIFYRETTMAAHTHPIPSTQASFHFVNQAKMMSHGKTTASSGIK